LLLLKKVNNIYQKVVAERTKHSQKPQEVRNRIKQIFGELNAIELFARQKTEGWDSWGNEVESDIDLLAGNTETQIEAGVPDDVVQN
jgi:site-specific DNA-methyltransferase (adenine-specific)